MSRILIISLSIVVILAGGYFLIQNESIPKEVPKPPLKLTIAMADNPTLAFIYIAQNKGYFRDEDLDVTYKKFGRGIDCLTYALKGDSDIATAYETPTVIKIYEGEKLGIISVLHTSTKNVALVARKDKGISTIDDLKGKKIGIAKNTAYEFFLYSYLSSQGIKLSDITFVDGEFANMATLLETGKVDAVAVGNPYMYDIEKGYPKDALTIFQSDSYTEDSLVSGRKDIIIDKKDAIIRFLKALVKAESFYKTSNQEALDAVIAELPAFSKESIIDTWAKITPILKLDNVLLTILNREGQWFKNNGIYVTEVPDFREAIFSDYLKSVKPDAVTIF